MKNLEENKYYIWLSSIEDISPITKIKLLNKIKNPQTIFNMSKEEILHTLEDENFETLNNKRKETVSNLLVETKYKMQLDNKINGMEKHNIKAITYDDIEYPSNLRKIYDYPICLYYIGNIDILNTKSKVNYKPKIAIIGCRDYSNYGEKCALKFSYELSKNGIIIVSGCARGIDSFAHKGAITSKSKTIAVLGNGLDYIYPPENKQLEEKILEENGLIISEYIIGTKPSKFTFPARNRIISGISDGLLVIEAKEKSGTLITVDFALDQGKNIYAVPGDINKENSQGTNELIKQGAKIVTCATDVLEDFGNF